MGVQVAARSASGHDLRQLAREGRLDLSSILAKRRLDVRQAESFVDLLLGLGDAISPSVSTSNRPYSFSLRPLRTAISRIRTLWAFEPVK